MIGKWWVKRAEVDRLNARIEAMEGGYAAAQTAVRLEARVAALEHDLLATASIATSLDAELRRLERQTADMALAIGHIGRRVEALRRMIRQSRPGLTQLAAVSGQREEACKAQDHELTRIATHLTILEHRIEAEAEQARRSATGLFDRIEGLRKADSSNDASS